MGDGVITAATSILTLTIRLHGAPTALLVPTGTTCLNIPVVFRFGVADRTMRPIIDRGRFPLTPIILSVRFCQLATLLNHPRPFAEATVCGAGPLR